MRVLQAGSSLTGWAGIERYIVYLAKGLTERGHQVSTTCAEHSHLASNVGEERICLTVRHKFDLKAMSAYIKLFRMRKFDIVHVHYNRDFLPVGLASKFTRSQPTLLTRHVALPWNRLKVRGYGLLYDCIVPVSDAARTRLLSSGVPAELLRMAKAGCPEIKATMGRDQARATLGMASDFQVGFFGRLAEEKGLRVLLEAAQQLKTNTRVNVFGDGPLRAVVEDAAKSNQRVAYQGFRTDVSDCLNAVDMVVIPSIWEEAFPFAALESLAAGRPVIASNIGGLPEIVEDGETGLLVPAGDPLCLARAIDDLAGRVADTRIMGEQSKKHHQAEFTIDKMAARMEAVYESLLASPRAS